MKKNDPHGAIKFGEFRKYMQNKQAKLKEQERDLLNNQAPELLFKGLSIHINGYTDPPQSELRRLVIQYGADFQHYLKKHSVTHIVATTLTNAKMHEFRSYKVVNPRWIMDSISANQLLPWTDYRVVPTDTKQKHLMFPSTSADQQKGDDLNAALLSKEWTREASSVNPNFIQKFYQASRLHHLSTWKAELRDIVRKMEQQYPASSRERKQDEGGPRVIMHIDFDCFFASVGLKDHPELKEKPVAVAHGKGLKSNSSSDIASCNYVARSFGIYNGMSVGKAQELCPNLHILPYEFEKYRAISEIFYKILFRCADQVQAVSVDEALVDVSTLITDPDDEQEEQLANQIRAAIREQTGCEASIGIGPNILLARLATRKAKPQNQYYCRAEQAHDFLMEQDIGALPGVGYTMKKRLKGENIYTIADLFKAALPHLQERYGPKLGQTLYNFARGIDERPLSTNQPRNSVSAEVNWGVRFENNDQANSFLNDLATEVSQRLENTGCKGKTITIKVMRRKLDAGEASKHLGHGLCDNVSKSVTLESFTDDSKVIGGHVKQMLQSFRFSVTDIRGIGIQVRKLNNTFTNEVETVNQGTLPFKPFPKENTPRHDPLAQLTLGKSGSVQASNHKPSMKVDRTVYAELSGELQKDLAESYHLEFIQDDAPALDRSGPEVRGQGQIEMGSQASSGNWATQSLPQLPPWSQLDPSSLLALPSRMRKQILEAYSKVAPEDKNKAAKNDRRQNPSERDPKRAKTGNKRSMSTRPALNTLTQMFYHQTSSPSADVNEDIGAVSDADTEPHPSNNTNQDQMEVYKHSNLAVGEKTIQAGNRSLEGRVPAFGVPAWHRPSLMGKTDLVDVRGLLKEWVATCDHPDPDDAETVAQYIVALVRNKGLETAQLVVMYLEMLTEAKSSSWQSCVSNVRNQLSTEVKLQYECDLRE